jgi:hypothetical protein
MNTQKDIDTFLVSLVRMSIDFEIDSRKQPNPDLSDQRFISFITSKILKLAHECGLRTSFETDADAKALEGKIATEEETNRRTTIT